MPSRPRKRRWLRWLAAACGLLVLAGAAGAAYLASSQPGDVVNEDVEFDATAPQAPPDTEADAGPEPADEAGGRRGVSSFTWPVYGYDKARTKYLPLAEPLRPPFAERWKLGGSILLEFPPAMGGRGLFLLKNNGALYGISRHTGKVRWKRKLGYLAASQPAYGDGVVYSVLLERGKGIKAGRVAAVRAANGRTKWSRKLPSRAESSPLLHDGTLYFGTEDGTVYALRASDGFVRWRYRADGAVKGALAYDAGKLYFGDYGGKVHAVRADTGRRVWEVGTSGGRFGLGSGNFYATPAVAFGRVYLGNTDGFVYSFSSRDGRLAWRKKTGGFVYSSPAVAQVPGGRPTVYVGSYDKRFYALDARTGAVRWSRPAGGRVSGGAQLLGDLVFFSTLERTTTALGANTGEKVWSTRRGGFNPVVSNGRGIFLVGFTTLYGLDGRPPKDSAAARAERRRAVGRRVARRRARQERALQRRVAARRRAVRERNRLRRSGARICFRSDGERVCRRPAPLVCVERASDGRTICRARERR
jgi:outer membrane protein assembly factor BamB